MISKIITLDWRAMKYYQIRGLLLPITGFIFGVIYSPILVIPFCVFIAMSFSVNPFAVEEKGELNHLYLTLPIKRREIVAGRYALSLIISLVGLIISIPMMLLSNTLSFSKWYIRTEDLLVIIALSFFMYSICNLFTFPILFKLGYQKGKFWGFYLPIILFASVFGGYLAMTTIDGNETLTINLIVYAANNLILVSGGFIILSILFLLTSYIISVKLYSKRNF